MGVWVAAVALASTLEAGCRLLPPNYVSVVAAGESGMYPRILRFDRGAAAESGARGVALLAGPRAAVLFDYAGGANRVLLLFRQGDAHLLYERIGQRPVALEATATIPRPAGIRLDESDDVLRGSIDVFVARSEHADAQQTAVFENYPRAMRLVGYFAVPQRRDVSGGTAPRERAILEDHEDSGWLAGFLGGDPDFLARLPVIDMQYLVPTTLLDRLGAAGG